MYWTREKLKLRVPDVIAAAVRASLPLDVQTCIAPGAVADNAMAPAPANANWTPLRAGQRWGMKPGADPLIKPPMLAWGIPAEGGSNHWLRTTVQVPQEWRGKPLFVNLSWQGDGQASLEAIVYL